MEKLTGRNFGAHVETPDTESLDESNRAAGLGAPDRRSDQASEAFGYAVEHVLAGHNAPGLPVVDPAGLIHLPPVEARSIPKTLRHRQRCVQHAFGEVLEHATEAGSRPCHCGLERRVGFVPSHCDDAIGLGLRGQCS